VWASNGVSFVLVLFGCDVTLIPRSNPRKGERGGSEGGGGARNGGPYGVFGRKVCAYIVLHVLLSGWGSGRQMAAAEEATAQCSGWGGVCCRVLLFFVFGLRRLCFYVQVLTTIFESKALAARVLEGLWGSSVGVHRRPVQQSRNETTEVSAGGLDRYSDRRRANGGFVD